MIEAEWTWHLQDAAGATVPEPVSPVLTSRFEAEEWLGLRWRELVAAGAARVTLLHRGAPVGPALDLGAVPAAGA